MRTILLLAALVAASAFAQGSIFPDKTTKKVAKQFEANSISEDVRAFLQVKMKNHAKEMKDLSVAVAVVNFVDVQKLAQDIANSPRLDPAVGPSAKLPARFFELQDLEKKGAQELADAAKAGEMTPTLEKYTQLVDHCMACHAAFKTAVKGK